MLLPPILRKFLETNRADRRQELLALRQDINQLVDAVRDQQSTKGNQKRNEQVHLELGQRIARIEEGFDEYSRADERTYRNIEISIQFFLFLATFAAFVVAGIYAWVAVHQWKETVRAADATAKASNTASRALWENGIQFDKTLKQIKAQTTAQQEAATAATEGVVEVQRAFVFASSFDGVTIFDASKKLSQIRFTTTLQNSGGTPAKHVFMHFNHIPSPVGGFRANTYKFVDMWDPGVPHVNTRTLVGPKGVLTTGESKIPASIIKEVTDNASEVTFYGWVTYHDVFRDTPTHLTEYCFRLVGFTGDPFTPNSSKSKTLTCEQNNCSDEDCPDYKTKVAGK